MLHMIKLCVGCDTVEQLLAWRREGALAGEPWTMRTRQTPKRAEDLIDGGSLYRVYRGQILSRQRILAVRTVAKGARAHCEVTLDEAVVRTLPTPRRAFQGWRYLAAGDAPPDLIAADLGDDLPGPLVQRLREIGAW
ncbi:MAG TPA: DUF1489 domain-containing protein [Caulobacteraceae bacterium]|jgi:hypothetical protein|nr:DUF1489 domain-containing protein [Caulobacteraceae bacterium]